MSEQKQAEIETFEKLDLKKYLLNTLEMVKQTEEGDKRNAAFDMLERLDIKIQKHNKAMSVMLSDKEFKDTASTKIDEAKKKFFECVSEVKDNQVRGVLRGHLKEARGELMGDDEEHDDEEEEGAMNSGRKTYVNKDPFHKGVIENPVKTKNCDHVYDEGPLRELLEKRGDRGVRCPVAGCPGKNRIHAEDLEPFPEFFRLCGQ